MVISKEMSLLAASGAAPEPEYVELGGRKVDKDGKFEFHNIPVGSHSLTARCSVGTENYSTRMTIQLEAAGLENVELRPVGPSSLTGQVQVKGESKSSLGETHISLQQPGGGMISGAHNSSDAPDGTVAEDGAFAFHGLPPNLYHIQVEPPPGLYVESVTWSGRDVMEPGMDMSGGGMSVALQVVLSANGGTIEGSVENGESAKVTLIPSDPQRVKALAKSVEATDGHFSFAGVPPGRYKLFAWEDVDVNRALYDPEFRKQFEAKGQTVELDEKQKATVQLKAIPQPEN
jgi:hypothetical protein